MNRFAGSLLAIALLVLAVPAVGQEREYDDCDAGFMTFVGSDAYQFSPAAPGELGRVRLFAILSYQKAGALGDYGRAFWRLEIRGAHDELVRASRGLVKIDEHGSALAEFFWDGRDEEGLPVEPGTYSYTFLGRFVPDRLAAPSARSYEELLATPGVEEAFASTRQVIVDYALTDEAAQHIRGSLALSSCQTQQNAPMEPGFPFGFYYGSTHSHSNFSDGGHPTSACSSGNAYGSGTSGPAAVYDYARNTAGLDFWVVNEHNHLINDSVANNAGPVTEAKVKQRYQDGRAAAAAATVDGSFVALFGMEWGVTTNADQGHVTLIETPVLFGWETCTNCNGASPECTPGTNCYFDVYTPKRYGYLTLYQRSVENPSPAGALGILCHPSSGEFDNYAFNANADEAIQGIAVRSGLAFSTATNCADGNVGATDYSARWKNALNLGFHVGPVADHDAHCNNYGVALPTRTVYLAAAKTRSAILAAHKARHFFAAEDANVQLVFATTDGAHVMGDIFDTGTSIGLRAAVYDPNGESVSSLELWRGQIGGGVPSAAYRTFANQSSFSVTESIASGTYYYYVRAVQADGHDVWSSPMWITFGKVCNETTAPAVAVVAPAAGGTLSCSDTTVRVTASDASGVASVQVQVDGGSWNAATYNASAGAWEWTWASAAAANGSHTLAARATDASCGANVGTASPITVNVDNTGCNPPPPPPPPPATGLDISGWKLTQANSTMTYTFPAGTKIPENGWLVVGRQATQAAFEAFWRGGTPLPSSVVYINTSGAFPAINGSETFTLSNAAGTKLDGASLAMSTSGGQTIQRKDPCLTSRKSSSWTVSGWANATPGTGAGTGCAKGVVINEFADPSNSGDYVYEFVELYYDKS